MRHWRARTLLPDILDGSLPPSLEAQVRQHVGGCRRCCRALAQLRACDQLLTQLPHSLFLASAPGATDPRMAALACWASAPEPSLAERLGATAVGAVAAAAMLLVMVSVSSRMMPPVTPHGVTLAAVVPPTALLPMGRLR